MVSFRSFVDFDCRGIQLLIFCSCLTILATVFFNMLTLFDFSYFVF